MSNAVSALGSVSHVDGYVDISEVGLQGMITLRGDLAAPEVAASILATGCPVPGPREIKHDGTISVAWMSPDELLILCPYEDAEALAEAMRGAVETTHALVVNVSDARAMFRLTGAGADLREVVAKLAPVDLSPAAFAPGQIRRTRLAQIPAAFHFRDAETCEIVCFRSVAQYAFDVLKSVSRPGGQVGFF